MPLNAATLAILFSTLATSMPHSRLHPFNSIPTTYTTNATFYQGEINPSDGCGSAAIAVATGNITTGTCNIAYTYGMMLEALKDVDCTYVLYSGSQACDPDDGTTSIAVTELAAGSEPVCVTTGVYDGGAHTYVSGMMSCKY